MANMSIEIRTPQKDISKAVKALEESGLPVCAASFYKAAEAVDAAKPFTEAGLSPEQLRQMGRDYAAGAVRHVSGG